MLILAAKVEQVDTKQGAIMRSRLTKMRFQEHFLRVV